MTKVQQELFSHEYLSAQRYAVGRVARSAASSQANSRSRHLAQFPPLRSAYRLNAEPSQSVRIWTDLRKTARVDVAGSRRQSSKSYAQQIDRSATAHLNAALRFLSPVENGHYGCFFNPHWMHLPSTLKFDRNRHHTAGTGGLESTFATHSVGATIS